MARPFSTADVETALGPDDPRGTICIACCFRSTHPDQAVEIEKHLLDYAYLWGDAVCNMHPSQQLSLAKIIAEDYPVKLANVQALPPWSARAVYEHFAHHTTAPCLCCGWPPLPDRRMSM